MRSIITLQILMVMINKMGIRAGYLFMATPKWKKNICKKLKIKKKKKWPAGIRYK